ncbi:hypothetical protein YB2330_000559 [Saitoella coloradoensis]
MSDEIHASVAHLVDRYTDSLGREARDDHDSDIDEDALFEELENEENDYGFREQRMQQLSEQLAKERDFKEAGGGAYEDITDDKTLMELTTTKKRVIAHFYHKDFRRCDIMHSHLSLLAKKHLGTRFVKVDVEKVPFLVVKLKIQVLPCVLSFVDAVVKDRIIGFEDIGNTDGFTTGTLEWRFVGCGVVERPKVAEDATPKSIFGFSSQKNTGGEDDDDWDEFE